MSDARCLLPDISSFGGQLFESSPDCVKVLDLDGNLLAMNKNGQCAMEIDDFGPLCGAQWTSFWPRDAQDAVHAALNAARAGGLGRFNAFCPTAKGSARWWDVVVTPVYADDGRVVNLLSVSRDVTELRALLTQARNSETIQAGQEERIRLLIQNAHDAVIGMDQEGKITDWNRQAETMLGWTAEEAIGVPMADLLPPERFKESHHRGMAAFLRTGQQKMFNKRIELPVMTKSGTEIMTEMTVGAVEYGGEYYFSTFVRDISQRKAMESKMHHQATHDFLTDLPNRYEFMTRLKAAIHRESRASDRRGLALLFIDLDGFKQVNDTFGHEVGDQVLMLFGEKLAQLVRKTDTAARLAGDEFVVLLEQVGEEGAQRVAQEILSAVQSRPLSIYGIGASIGIAVFAQGNTPEQLLSQADKAMYAAKSTGKNRVCTA